jgi:chaperonin GroEL
MTKKKILYGSDARKALAIGASKLADAVSSTLGPRSHNVAINREYPAPLVVHDGVTVAREVRLEDDFEDMGATLLREAASKTNDLAGDGTTTATVIANALIKEGMRLIDSKIRDGVVVGSINVMQLREDLIKNSAKICEELSKRATKIENSQEIEKVALVSAGDPVIAKVVTEALDKVGVNGMLMVEESSSFETTLEFQEGYEFDNGMLSPYFATDPHRMITEFTECYVLVTDMRIADAYDLVEIIEQVKAVGGQLLIIADDVTGPALQTLVMTKLRLGFQSVAVVAPEFADRRRMCLEDIALLTGATPIFHDTGKQLKEVKLSDLGKAKHVVVSQTHTTIAPDNVDREEVDERIASIKAQVESEDNAYRKARLEERIGKLQGGMAVIKVGGGSVTEMKELKERVIDAVHAVKAAMAEGIVAGGGVTLANIATKLFGASDTVADELSNLALHAPFETITSNAGIEVSSLFEESEGVGVNVLTGQTVDMIKEGIVDPVKVTRLAVTHAFSVAALLLTTNVIMTDIKEKKDANAYV